MSKKGGYKIIDFKGVNLDPDASSAAVIDGIFDSIEANHGKATLISGLVLDDVEKTDFFGRFAVSSGDYVLTIDEGTVTVTDDDEVTFAEPTPPEP